jgi:hypothetical protein
MQERKPCPDRYPICVPRIIASVQFSPCIRFAECEPVKSLRFSKSAAGTYHLDPCTVQRYGPLPSLYGSHSGTRPFGE